MNNGESEANGQIAAIEARREERKAAIEHARAEQYVKDLEAVDRLEEEHGPDRLRVLKLPSFVAGLPTVVVVRTPTSAEMKRHRQMTRKNMTVGQHHNFEGIGAALDQLGASCVIYPDEVTFARMKEQWPGLHDDVGVAANRLGEAVGKG